MRVSILAPAVLAAMLAVSGDVSAQLSQWSLGGEGGESWSDWTRLKQLVDLDSAPGAIQPLELRPDENILPKLSPWARWQEPRDPLFRLGQPRMWRGNVHESHIASDIDPLILVDGDPTTGMAIRDFWIPFWKEFYTVDLGAPVPLERFRFYPPEGVDVVTGEPYRPSYAQRNYEVTGTNDSARLAAELVSIGVTHSLLTNAVRRFDKYFPLDILLAHVENNFAFEVDVEFPLQYLRFIRYRPQADDPTAPPNTNCLPTCPHVDKFGLAELEVYGRGMVPEAMWESLPVDLGEVVNVGQVHYGLSFWRREGDQLVEAPEAPASGKIEVKIGLDDTPTVYYTYDDIGQLTETSLADFTKLKVRALAHNPEAVGWRGPIADDRDSWSFWSPPLDQSGDRPRIPRGRYLKLRVRLQTSSLWEFARIESVTVASSPVLATRVVAELAAADDLQPRSKVAQVKAGEPIEIVYDLAAEFDGEQSGFDAIRLQAPSKARLLALEMGDPPEPADPDSVLEDAEELTVYLPRPIEPSGDSRLRLHLETTVYDAAGEVRAEVFERVGDSLPQVVEPGDASDDLGTSQVRMLVESGSLATVLGEVEAMPAAFSPQGDGVNDQIRLAYTLFSVRAAQVHVEVYALNGTRLRQLYSGPQSAGPHEQRWDGRDDQGAVVQPGIYLMRVEVDADEGARVEARSVAVAY